MEKNKKMTASHSKGKEVLHNIKLKNFEFNPKDIKKFVHQYDKIDASVDMGAAKKARIELKRKIKEIKSIHISNKKSILSFKRAIEEEDYKKFLNLTVDLTAVLKKIEDDIEKVITSKALRAQKITNKISELSNDMINSILSAKTLKEINQVKENINKIKPTKNTYDDRVGDVESLKTTLILKAGGRELEITKAGGEIKEKTIKPVKINQDLPVSDKQINTDTDLLNFIQSISAAKGWKIDISPTNGVAIYQVNDPNQPLDIRIALENAKIAHEAAQVI